MAAYCIFCTEYREVRTTRAWLMAEKLEAGGVQHSISVADTRSLGIGRSKSELFPGAWVPHLCATNLRSIGSRSF